LTAADLGDGVGDFGAPVVTFAGAALGTLLLVLTTAFAATGVAAPVLLSGLKQ